MPRFSVLARSSAVALCLTATAAFADLTASDVWEDWQTYMAGTGYTISASEQVSGDTLTISDLSMRIEIGEDADEGAFNISMGSIRFVENNDGSVTIELPETSAIDFQIIPETGKNVSATIVTTMTDPTMTAAGDPSDVTYDFAATKTEMHMKDLVVDGMPMGQEAATVRLVADDMAYVIRSVEDDMRVFNQTTSIAALTYQVAVNSPTSSDTFSLNGAVQDIAFEFNGALPLEFDAQAVNTMLDAGMEFGGTVMTAGGNYDATFNGPDGGGTLNSTSQGAEWSTMMSPDGFGYTVSQRGVTLNMLLTQLPLPLSFAVNEIVTGFLIPVQKADEAQDFGLTVSLQGLSISDTIWGLFDPTGQLPRDPASLVLDLSGTAKVLFDFLDPQQAEVLAEAGTAPGELRTMTLDALDLDAVGARLTGAGEFSFDNGDLITFDGFPRPEGAIDLTLTGGNGLLDTLVNMGFVPQDQAMGTRMMMGLFAVPGEGQDTLVSKIEVNAEGHVLANGQRLR